MLRRRLISAAVIISVLVLLLYVDFHLGTEESLGCPGLILSLLGLITAVLAAGEFADMYANAAARVNSLVLMLASFAMMVVTCLPALWSDYPPDCPLGRFGFALSGVVVGMVVLFFSEKLTYTGTDQPRGEIVDRIGRGLLTLVYLSMLFSFFLNHRFLQQDNLLGMFAIVMLVTTVKLSDATAYFSGKALGTRKMAKHLSPGKTIEGAIGGLVGGCVGGIFCVYLVAPFLFGLQIDKALWWVLMYGVLVTSAGMFGDLSESLIKRDTNTKDSSQWLPGLGGILDVVDSLAFAAPVSFLLWL